ncbi:MAG: GntR family transcriptional regulator [Burkholderiaceae bacterium]|nr:GntR family transcriptional regulator [Burkholderiaceae bacterium]
MVPSLAPVERAPGLGDQVYQALRAQLRSGAIAAGRPLQEVQLAQQLGVSRTPVREALTRLASEGLLVLSGRSFAVPALTIDDAEDIYEVRFLLETAAMRRIAPLCAVDEIRAPIEEALEAAARAHETGDVPAFREAHAHFRAACLALVPNRRLVRVIEQYGDHLQHIGALTLDDPQIRTIVLDGLEQITRALRAGDGDAAAESTQRHLMHARHAFIIAIGLQDEEAA